LSKRLDGLDKCADVVWPDKLVVDLMLQPIWGAGPCGETISERGGIKVQHELAEPCAVAFGQLLQVLDERCFGEVLPDDEVESSA
jgi:hypothetical protein